MVYVSLYQLASGIRELLQQPTVLMYILCVELWCCPQVDKNTDVLYTALTYTNTALTKKVAILCVKKKKETERGLTVLTLLDLCLSNTVM